VTLCGVTIKNESLKSLAGRIVASLHWTGVIESEWRWNGSADEIHFIETNPRFPAWTYLTTIAGANAPSLLVRRLMGQKVEVPDHGIGVGFIRIDYDVPVMLNDIMDTSARTP